MGLETLSHPKPIGYSESEIRGLRRKAMHSTLSYNLQFSNCQVGAAYSLYTRARQRGQRCQLWASLRKRSRALLGLAEVRTTCFVEAQSDGDLRTVSIDQIRGSENRCADFDCDFYPVQGHTQERWLSIVRAWQEGKALPPVSLIQVGDIYFVQDGHHRISVARALGQKAVEARVVTWQVAGPLPWGRLSQAPSPPSSNSRVASILGWLSANLRSPERAAASPAAG
jgi:hypothetical protein